MNTQMDSSSSSPTSSSPSSSSSRVNRSHVTSDMYFPLWRHLLKGDFQMDICDPHVGRRLQSVFLAEFFKSSLSIIERLNLRTTQKDEEEGKWWVILISRLTNPIDRLPAQSIILSFVRSIGRVSPTLVRSHVLSFKQMGKTQFYVNFP